MRMIEKLPLPLGKIAQDLADIGVDATVVSAAVEEDERNVGTDVYLTLKVVIKDVYGERDTEDTSYNRAMDIL